MNPETKRLTGIAISGRMLGRRDFAGEAAKISIYLFHYVSLSDLSMNISD